MIPRLELEFLKKSGYEFEQPWQVVDMFEKKVAKYFGSQYAVATDSCTHALELCFRLLDQRSTDVAVPLHTYISVPMALEKIGQSWHLEENLWIEHYSFDPLPIVDLATVWRPNCYTAGTLACVSFQFKKQIPIGRGGMILTNDVNYYQRLQKMCRDGRDRTLLQTEDDIAEIGFHYYMTPEDAARGILLMDENGDSVGQPWSWQNYRPLTEFSVFKNLTVR